MASLNLDDLERPVSLEEPCGPDLDLEGDSTFLQFLARADGLMPASFFTRSETDELVPFDRSTIDFGAEYATLAALLRKTRDLRLLTFAARLSALERDPHACAGTVHLIAELLRRYWADVHPRGEDDDHSYRMAVLQVLDDMPTMILPLQHLPLLHLRRFGAVSCRSMMLATGLATPRAGERRVDRTDLERALREADPDDLAAVRASLSRLTAAAAEIEEITERHAGRENAVRLNRLRDLAASMGAFFAQTLNGSDAMLPPKAMPSGSEADGPATTSPPLSATGAVADGASARAALAAVSDYFRRFERSSPAGLLIRQAERLIGLSFHETLNALLPNHAEDASLYIGSRPSASFELKVDRIARFVGEAEAAADDDSAPAPNFVVDSRSAAVALLREVAAYYRVQEPSSPIPLFTDRACSLVNQDFLSILGDVLPGIRLARNTE